MEEVLIMVMSYILIGLLATVTIVKLRSTPMDKAQKRQLFVSCALFGFVLGPVVYAGYRRIKGEAI